MVQEAVTQKALWNGRSGEAWVAEQALLDTLLAPFEARLVAAAAASGAADLLDVGCGTGAVTLALARRSEGRGRTVGVDISEPMIDRARARAAREGLAAEFVLADAQDHGFEAAAFDMILSRFGVMFFEDPVAAFANLRRAARPAGRLCFVAWRSAAENGFMTTAERAAAPFLPELPPRRPDAPGQFAFGERERVRAILEQGGWTGIEIEPLDVALSLGEGELETYYSRLGPVGGALVDADPATRERVVAAVGEAFAPYVENGVARFNAACWWVEARA